MPDLYATVLNEIKATHPRTPWLRFDRYMELCLYADKVGYYTRPISKVGPEGDFYTSSNIGSIMGEMIAAWLHTFVSNQLPPDQPFVLVEWGGGTGRLARHILDELRSQFPETYTRMQYTSKDVSLYHQRLQMESVKDHSDKIIVQTAELPPDAYVIVLANELLDAFACRRFKKVSDGLLEFGVVVRDGRLEGEWRAAEHADFPSVQVAVDQQFEWVEGIAPWFAQLNQSYNKLTVIAIDYGDIQIELHGPHRMDGTFVCYRKHQVSDDPFAHPGEQDMTAHVNFTHVTDVAEQLGWTVEPLRTQKQFLLDAGILNKLQAHATLDPFSPEAKRNRAIRQLLISDQMSELFKVFIAHK